MLIYLSINSFTHKISFSYNQFTFPLRYLLALLMMALKRHGHEAFTKAL